MRFETGDADRNMWVFAGARRSENLKDRVIVVHMSLRELP